MPRVAPDYKEYQKNRILEAATRIFAEKGFTSTRMEEIAEALGYTKPVLYQHYASKESLFKDVATLVLSRYYEDFAAKIEKSSLQELKSGEVYEALMASGSWSPALSQDYMTLMAKDPDIASSLHSSYLKGSERLAGFLATLQKSGEIPSTRDPTLLAYGIMALADGVGLQEYMGMSREMSLDIWRVVVSGLLS